MAAMSLADVLLSTAQLQPSQSTQQHVRSARSRNRAAAWRRDLAQWREFQFGRATSERERQEIETEYTARMEAGPDFTQHHPKSTFDEAPLQRLSDGQRRELLRAFDAVRRWSWLNGRKARGQAVSRAYREVLSALIALSQRHGRAFPSYEKLAQMACCSRSTVWRAINWLKAWGLLDWSRRLKRTQTRLGTVVRQASNGYRIAEDLVALGKCFLRQVPECHHLPPSKLTRLITEALGKPSKPGAASGSTPIPF